MKRILLVCMLMGVWSMQAQEGNDNCPVVDNATQMFCESEGSGNNYYRPAVEHLSASANGAEVVWYDSVGSTEPLPWDQLLENGEDYYAGTADGECTTRAVVTVILNDSPSAGATTFYTVSIDGEPFDLLDVFKPSILGPAEAGGTVDPPLSGGGTIFDPSVDQSGDYTYRVPSSNEFCPDDWAVMYITVEPDDADEPGGDDPDLGDEPAAQNCPIVEQPQQAFCQSEGNGNDFYRPSVADLSASADGDEIAWYDTATSIDPLPMDELLSDEEDYYAGNISGTCENRARVEVVMNVAPSAGSTTFVSFCSEAGPVDILDYINPSILRGPDPGGTIEPAFQSGTTLFDPLVDGEGEYVYHVTSPNEFCSDDKAVIYISVSEPATAGEDIEVFFIQNEEPRDLSAEINATPGAELTWEPPLNSGTSMFDPLVDSAGEYTVSVSNGEGCEDDSAIVNVIIGAEDVVGNCPIVEFPTQNFCESEGSENNFYRPAVSNLAATANGDGVAWYDTELSGEPLSEDEILIDGEDYWAGDVSGACQERQKVVVSLSDSPSAGSTTFLTVNSTDAPFDLLDVLEESILGPAEAGGVVEPPLASGGTIFDPAVDAGGDYVYHVASNSSCPDDKAACYITVVDETQESAMASNTKISVYPNPSLGDINLSLKEGVIPSSLRIYDLNGNTVKSMELNSNEQLLQLDISGLKSSLYFAEIKTNQGTVVKRILKK